MFEQKFRDMTTNDGDVVIGQFQFSFKLLKTPIPFLGGPESPRCVEIHRSLKLALTTIFEHHSDLPENCVTSDYHMCKIIRGGAELRIGRHVGTTINYAFSQALVQMMSTFLLFNDFRVRGKLVKCNASSDELRHHMATNHKCVYNYMRGLYCNPTRCNKFFRTTERVKDFAWSTVEVFENMKNWFDKAKRGICCSWLANSEHPGCLWVHHFAVLQSFHRNLIVVGRSPRNELMSDLEVVGKTHTFQFFGGTWTNFFDYNNGDDVRGSRLIWTGDVTQQ